MPDRADEGGISTLPTLTPALSRLRERELV